MNKIKTFLIYIFMGVALVNFVGVFYFKTSNIEAFTKYIEFCSKNEVKLKEVKDKKKVEEITKIYRSFQEKGIVEPKKMISYHVKNVKQGAPLISTYYKIYQMGKGYDLYREVGEKLIEEK